MADPKFPLTVPRSVWNAVAEAKGEPFADSYLTGARLDGSVMTPHTTIAHDRLKELAGSVLDQIGLTLNRPKPYGHPSRRDGGDRIAVASAWSAISDAEYDRLSLSDKIRHQRILANVAQCDAGPQSGPGRKGIPADKMPQDWHRFRAKASNHLAEVDRLFGKLQGVFDRPKTLPSPEITGRRG